MASAHGVAVGGPHAALLPSQNGAVVTPDAQLVAPHAVLAGFSPHAPEAHTSAHGPVAHTPWRSATPSSAVQLPVFPVRLQAWQAPLQATLQQT